MGFLCADNKQMNNKIILLIRNYAYRCCLIKNVSPFSVFFFFYFFLTCVGYGFNSLSFDKSEFQNDKLKDENHQNGFLLKKSLYFGNM